MLMVDQVLPDFGSDLDLDWLQSRMGWPGKRVGSRRMMVVVVGGGSSVGSEGILAGTCKMMMMMMKKGAPRAGGTVVLGASVAPSCLHVEGKLAVTEAGWGAGVGRCPCCLAERAKTWGRPVKGAWHWLATAVR